MNDELPNEGGHVAEARGLKKYFQTGPTIVRAVDGVSFRIPRGTIVALQGPSGCGKSTLLNLMGALDRPDVGELLVDDISVGDLSGQAEVVYRRCKVGFVFQQFNLIRHLSALENVTLPMELSGESVDGRPADLLRSLRAENRTVLIATHDEAIAGTADLVMEMSDGQIVASRLQRKEQPEEAVPEGRRHDGGGFWDRLRRGLDEFGR